MKRIPTLLTLLAICLLAASAVADVPPMINYQGRLTDDSGDPVTTTVQMVFTICVDSVGSACSWTEVHPAVEVEDGLFNVILGSVTPLSTFEFAADQRWLGIMVGGEHLPYTRLISAGFAHHSAVADTALTVAGAASPQVVEDLQEQIRQLEQRIAELEAKLE